MSADRLPVGSRDAVQGRQVFRKLAGPDDADPDTLTITLFRRADGAACGWFIGPFAVVEGRAIVPHLPRSDGTRATVAVVRAIEAGKLIGCPVCVIDPDDLWDNVWSG